MVIFFKKLRYDIWDFSVRHGNNQIRLFAFWNKTDNIHTMVFATHGYIKKVDKVPDNEIERAKNIGRKYFESKK